MYKKRAGTSGISGHLYETKLISLILLRLQHDDNVEDFCLSSNMADVGAFDDICLKIKIKGRKRPIVVFLQAKHKINSNMTFDIKSDLFKWVQSIMKIKQKFSLNNQDAFFKAEFSEIECVFIIYTNANCNVDEHTTANNSLTAILNNLIATSDAGGSKPLYTDEDLEDCNETMFMEPMSILAKRFVKFLNDKPNSRMDILNDDYIALYHVILAKKVVHVSNIKSDEHNFKYRTLTFRDEFFDNDDKCLKIFRKHLYEEVLINRAKLERSFNTQNEKTEELATQYHQISLFLSDPSVETLSPLAETHITYKNGSLVFTDERLNIDVEKLKHCHMEPAQYADAKILAARKILKSFSTKVPVVFGNKDILVRGNPNKIERRLNHLANFIEDLCNGNKCQQMNSYKVITIDDTIDEGYLNLNGGLASAIGNILVYDKKTNLLKFNDILLENNARTLYDKLTNKIEDLKQYRVRPQTIRFPRLTLDFTNIVKHFFEKIVIFAKQSDHYGVARLLKQEIETHLNNYSHNFQVQLDTLCVCYHDEIQKWWMMSKTAPYITKSSDLYRQVLNNMVIEPQMNVLQHIFHTTNLNNLRKYTFSEDSTELFTSLNYSSTKVIISEMSTLTTIKLIQFLRKKSINKHAILDLKFILTLPNEDFLALGKEIKKTNRTLVIVCDDIQKNKTLYNRLDDLIEAAEEKNIIVITSYVNLEIVRDSFPLATDFLTDTNYRLIDLAPESQINVLKDAQVIFQGHKVSLDLIVDNVSITFINQDIMTKIFRNETFEIGESLSSPNYEEIKHLYMERKVRPAQSGDQFTTDEKHSVQPVRTFYDIEENVVLITATPGMGKSTLLTDLSLATKKRDPKLWIVRINLLNHSKEFHKWQENKTVVNTLESLKFLCRIIIKNDNVIICLRKNKNKVHLRSCTGDEWDTFILNMFLHFYNERRLIFLFDGFDEICPHYKIDVIKFFNVVKKYPRLNKMLVTSRPYNDVLSELQRVLGKSYELEYINDMEQVMYLQKFWQNQLILELDDVQYENVMSFMNFVADSYLSWKNTSQYGKIRDTLDYRFRKIYIHFFEYIFLHLPHIFKGKLAVKIEDMKSLIDPWPPSETNTLLGTPLYLYMIADYFVNAIDNKNINKWYLNINILTVYEMFVETKLKKILFQDKNHMDVYNPDIITKYEKESAECISIHKKMAAYQVLWSPIIHRDLSSLESYIDEIKREFFIFKDYDEFQAIINRFKLGIDKTGLITHLTSDDLPVFIHNSFSEYFAAEAVSDLLKSDSIGFNTKIFMFSYIYLYYSGLWIWLKRKMGVDDKFTIVIKEIERRDPLAKSSYYKLFRSDVVKWTHEQYTRFMSSTVDDYEKDLYTEYYNDSGYVYMPDLYWGSDVTSWLREFNEKVVARMKPHLKKYFVST